MSQNPYAKKRGFKNDSKDRAAVVGNVVGVEVACDYVKLICASEERSKPRNANMWGTAVQGLLVKVGQLSISGSPAFISGSTRLPAAHST
jgi:hypothetical protein